jgi:hypothetical protein
VKLLLDENLSPRRSSDLRSEGYDAYAVIEIGLSGATDEQILRDAIENGRVIVTLDADFANCHTFSAGTYAWGCAIEGPSTHGGEHPAGHSKSLAALAQHRPTGRLAIVDKEKIRIR